MSDSLHAQGILAHRFSAVLVTARFLLEEEALREPECAVLTFAAGNQHAHHQDYQQEQRSHPY